MKVQTSIVDFIKKQPREQWVPCDDLGAPQHNLLFSSLFQADPELNFDVILTTYEIAIADEEFLKRFRYRLLIVDEAHRLKNDESKLYQILQTEFHIKGSLLLSGHCCFLHDSPPLSPKLSLSCLGTPIQNNMAELWAMMHFVMPKIFDDKRGFVEFFSVLQETVRISLLLDSAPLCMYDDLLFQGKTSLEKNQEKERVAKDLHALMRPFILRRTKQDVLIDLPELTETVIFTGTPPNSFQLCLMNFEIHFKECPKCKRNITSGSSLATPRPCQPTGALFPTVSSLVVSLCIYIFSNQLSKNIVLMSLRKCCNHPYLFDGAEPTFDGEYQLGDHIIGNSGKMVVLDKLLAKLKSQNEKVLVPPFLYEEHLRPIS